MNYPIVATYKDYTIFKFTSAIVPKIGENICGPHKGSYKVTDIRYHISDDCYEFENKIMWIELKTIKESDLIC